MPQSGSLSKVLRKGTGVLVIKPRGTFQTSYKRRDSGGRDFLLALGIHVSNAKIERKINFVVYTFRCVVQNIEIYPFQT